MKGTITQLFPGKTFGYITGADKKDRFFEAGAVLGGTPFRDLEVGDHVTFEHQAHARGLRAVNVLLFGKAGDLVPPLGGDDDDGENREENS